MASFPWNAPTSRTTGIAAESIANAAGFVGSAIDNSANLDDTLDLQVTINCATAPTANTVLYVYLLFAIDGTNYEDGSTSLQPVKVPVASIPARAVTGAQVVSVAIVTAATGTSGLVLGYDNTNVVDQTPAAGDTVQFATGAFDVSLS